MTKNNKNLLFFVALSCLLVFIIISPDWLKLNGVSPCWPVILLLPFSLKNSRYKASVASVLLGIFIDSFTLGDASYIPSLFFLSLAWSTYGLHNKKIESFLNIGLMAIFGTVLVGISIWVQKIVIHGVLRHNWFHAWSIYVLISEVIITGLVAPFFSSWLLIAYKKN
tara:strand:+ start:86 stop:586 length:501 start_codon:yes stop_codon:yes gene_type:complete